MIYSFTKLRFSESKDCLKTLPSVATSTLVNLQITIYHTTIHGSTIPYESNRISSKRQELAVLLLDLFEYLEQLLHGLGTQHSDAQLLEVGQPLEEWCSGQVAAYVQYATAFIKAGYASHHLFAKDIHPLIEG